MKKDLFKQGYTQNREMSWLHFDDRCLNEAKDKTVPLAERLKFVSIFTSNLTEFFMVRVGSLLDMTKANYEHIDNKSGMTPSEQLAAIYPFAKRACKKRDEIYADLKKKMAKAGIRDLLIEECTKAEQKDLRKYFKRQCAPLLAPQIVDIHHPFPNLQSGETYIAAILKYKTGSNFSVVPVPKALPSIIPVGDGQEVRFVHTEDLIMSQLANIYPDAQIIEAMKITVARSAYVDADDEAFEEIKDYRKKMLRVLKERRKMNVTMLVCSKKPSQRFEKILLTNLKITKRELFVCDVPMDLKYAFSLPGMLDEEKKEKLLYTPYVPKLSPALDYHKNLFEQIQEKDVLLSYPYESMEPFLQLLKEAASDPDVVSIKITFYRLASHARLVEYLCLAAENGKEVDVLIELKARFDEQNNIDYSERLEDAGCNVIYGFEKYKVHSKICLITKVKDEVNSHVVLVSTGNFNENTAKQYTDLSILTSDPGITEDAISFFQNMAIGKLDGTYHSLLVAPVSLKPTVMDLMDREIAKGKGGYIFAKINAITDEEIIVKLKEASCAGVKVEMIVRGISCILPSVEGKTDRIRIRSVVGRYLEHSRIYIFGKGEEEKMYIASADFMTRNMERRVEIACPINDPEIRKTIHAYADTYLADNTKARLLHSNGRYHKIKSDDDLFCAQDALMDSAVGSNQTIARSPQRPATSAFKTKFKKEKKKKKKEKKEK